MQKWMRLTFPIIIALLVSCSSSGDGPDPEPGQDMPDNRIVYKDLTYNITAGITHYPDQSSHGNEVLSLLIEGENAAANSELRIDMVIHTVGSGLVAGAYPFKLYNAEPPCVKWGSVVVYDLNEPSVTEEQLNEGELQVYSKDGIFTIVFTGKSHGKSGFKLVSGKFKGRL